MFGTGLLKGLGITLKHFTDTFADDRRKEPARYEGSIQIDARRRVIDQPITQEGLLTIQYPEERRLLPERFRYIPMLIWDTEVGEDRCTACGICAKVCPPQCIWIVRDMDDNGKPVTRPSEFYIDVAVGLRQSRADRPPRILCSALALPVRRRTTAPGPGKGRRPTTRGRKETGSRSQSCQTQPRSAGGPQKPASCTQNR